MTGKTSRLCSLMLSCDLRKPQFNLRAVDASSRNVCWAVKRGGGHGGLGFNAAVVQCRFNMTDCGEVTCLLFAH